MESRFLSNLGRGWSFFFQAVDGIRDWSVTGVQACALPIFMMVSLSQTHMKGIRVNLPAAVGPPPTGVKDFVSIKVLEGNAVFFDNAYVADDQVLPDRKSVV